MATINERNGGTKWVSKVVNDFYAAALSDPQLAPFFKGISIASLIDHQIEFVSIALGKPTKYGGSSLFKAHQHLKISKEIFEHTVKTLLESFLKNGTSYSDMEEIDTLVRSLEDQIVTLNIKRRE